MTQLHNETQTQAKVLKEMQPAEFQSWYSRQVDLARQITEPLNKAVQSGSLTPLEGARIGASIFFTVLNPNYDGNNTVIMDEVRQHLSGLAGK